MQYDTARHMTGACALALLVLAASASLVIIDDCDAETAYDRDYGRFYSYTLQFVFDGSDAQTIEWDFGDGSTSDEWNPTHTYAEKGVYYVTQTTTNTYNGGSVTTQVYRVEMMGFPVISFDTHGGPAVEPIQQTAYNVKATQPRDPVREGHVFGGWYDDAELTEEHNWDGNVIESITLHARWTPVQTVTSTVTFDVAGGSGTVEPMEVPSGSAVTLPGYDGTLDGREFAGWVHGSTTYQPGQRVTVAGDMTFTASWEDPEGPTGPDDGGDGPDSPGDDGDDSIVDRLTGPDSYKYVLGLVLLAVLVGTLVAVARRP